MKTIYDRLYGELKFPSIILDLLNCPGLLRLRDVRMANNQFVAFPSFASTSRYEHSLGVCHLAGLCAESLNLSEKEKIELMMACLYHDVGTPPFAHAMEEVLQAKYNFDHEQHLRNVILDKTNDFQGNMIRVFQDEGLKLRSVCQSKKGQEIGVDLYRIAKIAAGDKSEYLSPLLNGNGMDLDNIDNVIRASSAMGIWVGDCKKLAEKLACSFKLKNNNVYYDGNSVDDIRTWQRMRDIQYTAIFESIDDFAYQTMIKKSINLLMNNSNKQNLIETNSWTLTDSSIIHDYLLANPQSRDIIKRVLLCRPYQCLGILHIKGDGVSRYINKHLFDIERISSDYFINLLSISSKKLDSIPTNAVVANFYPDKRKRQLLNKAIKDGREFLIDEPSSFTEGALLGLFTPFSNSNHRSFEKNGVCERRLVSFKKENLIELMNLLSNSILKGYEIRIY